MGAMELLLEHRGAGKTRRLVRVRGGAELFVIGSSPSADLRLMGKGVGGCHAALRRNGDEWVVCDLSGSEGTRIEGAPIVERVIELDKPVSIEIGPHALTVIARRREQTLFDKEEKAASGGSGRMAHEAVVRNRRGKVIEVKMLDAKKSFAMRHGGEKTLLAPPTSEAWVTTTVGSRVVMQRLVPAQEAAVAEGFQFDRNMKKPLLAVLAFFFMLGLLVTGLNRMVPREAALDDKSKEIIFNAKAVKMKRDEARKIVKARAQQKQQAAASSAAGPKSPAASQQEQATAPKSTAKASQALASLRASGLSALVGKIAKRAAKQGVMVAAVGVAPDAPGAGRAFFSHGSATVGGGGAAKEGPAFRLGGIATVGKGGGAGGAAKIGTGLSAGKVGVGDVALVDEETVVEGGLDRDVIADVIKKNLGQIRYCYERQLSSNPDLYGKVLVKFNIVASGDVGEPKIDGTTMKNSMVEGCILRRIAGWKFPLPKGGTMVKVSYPFLFKATE